MNWENLPSTTTPLNATNLQKITDSGSNTNGFYVKFQDGTLIQWGEISLTTGTTSYTVGGLTLYRTSSTSQTFPISFHNSNEVNIYPQINGGDTSALNFIYTTASTSSFTIRLQSTESDYTRAIRWFAVGKWK